MTNPAVPDPPRRRAELAASALLTAWRAFAVPAAALPTDWLFLVGVYWLGMSLPVSARLRSGLTLVTLAYLAIVYLGRQLPMTIGVLGGAP